MPLNRYEQITAGPIKPIYILFEFWELENHLTGKKRIRFIDKVLSGSFVPVFIRGNITSLNLI